ncbi:MAG: S-layer homology domain-containing protein [Quinella sp. 1Q5]|nr:S-layer homology domain-containing protein [Quinella sp. 1Q5]
MKKTVVAALAATFVMGVGATTSAAANPFSDVPQGHWAYNSVSKLAAEGVIEGYGDGTYRGDRNITRYEMAQMIAKAMAKNPTGANKAELDRLAAEFRDELDALGVRVAELEKYADKVVWQGKIEYTYKNHKTDDVWADRRHNHHSTSEHTRVKQDDWIFRFEPIAHVNDHWTLRARIDAHVDLSRDTSTDFELVRGWAQGDYDNFQIRVGKQPLYTNEDGIIWDTEYTGGEVTFGKLANGLRATIYGGRLDKGNVGGGIRHAGAWDGRHEWDDGKRTGEQRFADAAGNFGRYYGDAKDPSSFWAINVQYDPGSKGLFGGLGYYNIKDDDLNNVVDPDDGYVYHTYTNKDSKTDKAQIWSVNAGYRIGKVQLWGAYAKNTKADIENKSWQALLRYGDLYGGGNQNTHKGQWAVWAGYKELGSNASLHAINWDDAYAGTKGFVAGASWAPFDRIVIIGKYFKGKYITGPGDAERLFGRVEFFF